MATHCDTVVDIDSTPSYCASHPSETTVSRSYDTVWESEDGEPDQWYGVKFAEKKDIKSMVIRIPDMVKGPASVMVEKSEDGESWGRVVDISDMKMWGVEDQLYKFVPMDQCKFSHCILRGI